MFCIKTCNKIRNDFRENKLGFAAKCQSMIFNYIIITLKSIKVIEWANQYKSNPCPTKILPNFSSSQLKLPIDQNRPQSVLARSLETNPTGSPIVETSSCSKYYRWGTRNFMAIRVPAIAKHFKTTFSNVKRPSFKSKLAKW